MIDILQWMTANPVLTYSVFILLCILLLAVLAFYVIAFRQGREITIWQMKIGPLEKNAKLEKDKASQRGMQKETRLGGLIPSNLSANLDESTFQHAKGWKSFEPEILQQLKTSTEVRILKIKGREIYKEIDYKESIRERTKAGKFTRILLQRPNSKYVTQAVSEVFHWDSFDDYLKDFQTAQEVLKGLIRNYKEVVRLYDETPLLKLYIFDSDIYLSIYTGTLKDRNKDLVDVWHLSRQANEFDIPLLIEHYFETLWNESQNFSLIQNKCVILNPDTYFVSIQVSSEQIKISKDKFTFRQREFCVKSEFHITIIGSNLKSLFKEKLENDPVKKQHFLRAVAETDWSYELGDQYYHMVEEQVLDVGESKTTQHLESIIQMVDVPGLEMFYKKLAGIFQIEIPRRPTHLTLYTFGSEIGIGISTQAEFDKFSHGEIDLQKLIQG